MGNLEWVDEVEKQQNEERSKDYFNIAEGDNRIQILTHAAPLAQVWMPGEKKYRPAQEGEQGASIKGVCWVLHEGMLKQAKLPYTVIKAVRSLQNDQDWAFESFPMPRVINIKAKGAGTKEVEYSVIPSPKESEVPTAIMEELAKKPTPEEIIEKVKSKVSSTKPTYPPFNEEDQPPF